MQYLNGKAFPLLELELDRCYDIHRMDLIGEGGIGKRLRMISLGS